MALLQQQTQGGAQYGYNPRRVKQILAARAAANSNGLTMPQTYSSLNSPMATMDGLNPTGAVNPNIPDPWEAAGGYNAGVYDFYKQNGDPNFQVPSLTPTLPQTTNPHVDRTYTNGGIGKQSIGQYMIPDKGMANFGQGYLNSGQFGTQGLNAIHAMGFADQNAYLAANPNLQAAYNKRNPSTTVKLASGVGPSVLNPNAGNVVKINSTPMIKSTPAAKSFGGNMGNQFQQPRNVKTILGSR